MPTETLMMKDSKIGSIKDIPINWEIKKTKYLFDVVNGSTPDSDYYDYWDGAINWITPADMVDFGYVSTGERSITKKGYKSCGTTLVPSNSIVISTRAPIGKINIAKSELCTNQGCKCLVSEKLCNKYFYYLLYSQKEQLIDAGRGTTFIELSTFSLSNFSLILPPLPEQQTIADFLDEKCEKINNVISEIEEQIQILEDYKKSLITETVTKGLDKNVPMKDSGIDWIGQIPQDWDIKKLKYCCKICNGAEYADFEVTEGGYPVMGSGGEFARASKYSYDKESVLLGRKGTIDKPLYVDLPFWAVDTMFYTKINKNIYPKFLYYSATKIRFDYYVTATALPSMTQRDLGSEPLTIPPYNIQKQIADYLDKEFKKIDKTISDKKEQLETIKEYKKSLIYEYVTGKKRVAC